MTPSKGRLRILIALSALLAFKALGAPGDERAVVSAVLTHFAARTDTWFYDKTARLAIRRNTYAITDAASNYQYVNQGEGNCSIPKTLYLAMAAQNQKGGSSIPLVEDSPGWWVIKPGEDKRIRTGLSPPPGYGETIPVKTVVGLLRPGFSEDGNRALVFLDFLWSIHGAEAQYVIARRGGIWVVECSHLSFFV